jgi:hypothetical protein
MTAMSTEESQEEEHSNLFFQVLSASSIHIVFKYLICVVLGNLPYQRAMFLQVFQRKTSSLRDKKFGHLRCHEYM